MKKVLGIGNALVDVLMRIDNDSLLSELNLPKGSMQLIDKPVAIEIDKKTQTIQKEIASGGSAANTINGLANLGVKCGYVGKIGNDIFGGLFRKDLESRNVDTNLLLGTEETGRANTFISADGERTFGTFLGSAVELTSEDLTANIFGNYDYLHIEGYLVFNNALIEKALQLAKECSLKVSLDMASFNVVEANKNFLTRMVADYVDILFANEEEAKAFTGKEPEGALDEIAEMCEIAVVKIGEKGSLIKSNGTTYRSPSIKANCIDTTGAGDLYAAGFLYGLINGKPLDECGRIGGVLGGNVIEVIGAKMKEERWKKIMTMV